MKKRTCRTILNIVCVVALVFCMLVGMVKTAEAAVSPLTVHAGTSVTVSYQLTGAFASQIGSVTSSDSSIVTPTITSKGITIGSTIAYMFDVCFLGKKAGTATVEFYNENGWNVGSVSVTVTDHIFGSDGEIAKEPTCTEPGQYKQVCDQCDEELTTSIPATGHDNGQWVTVKEPTCTVEGSKELQCTKCTVALSLEVIPATGHDDGKWEVIKESTCTDKGAKELKCTVCSTILDTEEIAATGHDEGKWEIVKDPTCTGTGTKELKCTACSTVLDTEEIPATGHADGKWEVTKPATCNKDGEKVLKCAKCSAIIDTEAVEAAGVDHTPGEAVVTKEATCTDKGERIQKCTVCETILKTEEIPAIGHQPGELTVTKEAGCVDKGEKIQKCTVCTLVLKTEEIPATGHQAGELVITKEATCIAKGEKTQKCTVCGTVTKSEEIPATGHDGGKWVTTKKATRTEAGERQLLCTKCNAILETEVLPIVTTVYYPGASASSMGIRFRDLENPITDKWYMFTPLDLSSDGEQTFDLIASNAYKIGTVTIKVADGEVTISYDLVSSKIEVLSEFMTLFPSIADVTTVDSSAFMNYEFGSPISIADDLGGNTSANLYICNIINYNDSIDGVSRFFDTAPANKELVNQLMNIMK